MVGDEAYAALVADNQRLTQQLAAALRRIAVLETRLAELKAKKTPPPRLVSAG